MQVDTIDLQDKAIIAQRIANYARISGPRVGDFVTFADGKKRRVAHVWPADWNDDNVARVQTTDGGSFYLGDGYISYSGSLYPSIKADTLREVGKRDGRAWIFHHDWHVADGGVDFQMEFRSFISTEGEA